MHSILRNIFITILTVSFFILAQIGVAAPHSDTDSDASPTNAKTVAKFFNNNITVPANFAQSIFNEIKKSVGPCDDKDECHDKLLGYWLRGVIYNQLVDKIVAEQHLVASDSDIQAVSDVEAANGDLKTSQLAMQQAAWREKLKRTVLIWKANQYLYKKFGGDVESGGINWLRFNRFSVRETEYIPLGAIKAALAEYESDSELTFSNEEIADQFWQGFIIKLGKELNKQQFTFDEPWWAKVKNDALAKVDNKLILSLSLNKNKSIEYAETELLSALMDKLIHDENIKPTTVEIMQYQKLFPMPAPMTPKQTAAMTEYICSWKANQYLYKTYGGVVGQIKFDGYDTILPIGAMKQYFQQQQKAKNLIFYNNEFEQAFWNYLDHPKTIVPAEKVDFDFTHSK